jgi:hypothetical protein
LGGSVTQMASVVGAGVVAAEEVLVADGITATIRAPGLRLFGFDVWFSSLEWGREQEPSGGSVRPGTIAAASEVAGESPGVCRPVGPPMWGVVRTCGGGTGVPFVMAP